MSVASTEGVADIGSEFADLDPSTDRYARRFQGPAGEWLLSCQTKALRRLCAPYPGARVLDVGGGHAQVATPLLDDGHEVCVYASSQEALGQMRRLHRPGLTTEVGPLRALPYADRSFDVVTSFRILAHVGDWQAFLGELCRVARRAVIVDFPIASGANTLEPLLFGLKKRLEGDTRRFQTMSRPQVLKTLAAAGFAPQGEIGKFVLPMVVHRKLARPAHSARLEAKLRALRLDRSFGTPVVLCAARDSAGMRAG